MLSRRKFGAAVLAFPAGLHSQRRSSGSQKAALVSALGAIRDEASRIQEAYRRTSEQIAELADSMFRSARWMASVAAEWTPKTRDEGTPLVRSVERLLEALESAPTVAAELEPVLRLLEDDLSLKASHCRARGLAATQRVTVITKRQALHEVKGLEVLYIEKFLQSDTTAVPNQFRRFSSPATDDLAPGRYVFWSKEPGERGRTGGRKEARVSNGSPAEPIEVLAP